MAKQKTKYLPIMWAENFKKDYDKTMKNVSVQTVRKLVEASSAEMMDSVIESSPQLAHMFRCLAEMEESNLSVYGKSLIQETLSDLNSISLVLLWAENKQVYAFDKDFTEELVRTEEIIFTKDCWDFLPYDVFYIDFSDNKELCRQIGGEGMFVKAVKTIRNGEECYELHICKVNGRLFFTDIFSIPNNNHTLKTTEIEQWYTVDCYDAPDFPDGHYEAIDPCKIKQTTTEVNGRAYETLVFQMLMYLSSVEPDVEENPETKQTYRKPAPNTEPKNRYSEVRKWDVGVRFGNAYRTWKKQSATTNTRTSSDTTKSKQRPHSRKAHWSHYWYGHGEDKVRRAKWVSAYYVGLKTDDNPAVIHKVEKT